jgi:hypothetical protein
MQLPQEDDIKYLRPHLDRRHAWHKHTVANWKQLGITLTKMYRLLGSQSKLYIGIRVLIYKAIFKQVPRLLHTHHVIIQGWYSRPNSG